MADRTTRTDSHPDRDVADMGYHYPNYIRATVDWHSLLGHPQVLFCVENYGTPRSVDIYIGVIDPGGGVWSYTEIGFKRGNYPRLSNVKLPAGYSYADLAFALDCYTLPDGRYTFALVVTEAGSGFDNIYCTSYHTYTSS